MKNHWKMNITRRKERGQDQGCSGREEVPKCLRRATWTICWNEAAGSRCKNGNDPSRSNTAPRTSIFPQAQCGFVNVQFTTPNSSNHGHIIVEHLKKHKCIPNGSSWAEISIAIFEISTQRYRWIPKCSVARVLCSLLIQGELGWALRPTTCRLEQ